MNTPRGFGLTLLCILAISASACERKAPPPTEEGAKPGGVFGDVIEAIDQVKAGYPEEEKRDSSVGRSEWDLIVSAREKFLMPPFVLETPSEDDYYIPGETEGGAGGDALDVILDTEWEEYKNLVGSVAPEKPSPELREEVKSSLGDLYRDLPPLMEATPDLLRERVMHIVTLRYYNTILRAGANPRWFAGSTGS